MHVHSYHTLQNSEHKTTFLVPFVRIILVQYTDVRPYNAHHTAYRTQPFVRTIIAIRKLVINPNPLFLITF